MNLAKKGRHVNGILLLDKPDGITSNAALQRARLLFQARKAGHTGSLDPLATGMLPLCFGSATKVCGTLLASDKEYQVTARLGVRTDTGDRLGQTLVKLRVTDGQRREIEQTLKGFIGESDQTPPMFSAAKYRGQPLYKLARSGVEVERSPKKVTIHEIIYQGVDDDLVHFSMLCSKGTYVRTLVDEFGEKLGCSACVETLRRTYVRPFRDNPMYSLDDVREAQEKGLMQELLLPMDSAFGDHPEVVIDVRDPTKLTSGRIYPVIGRHEHQGQVRVYSQDRFFIGIGQGRAGGRVEIQKTILPSLVQSGHVR